MKIHSTAIIHPGAIISKNVEIGPFSVIDKDVKIDEGSIIHNNVTITGNTTIAKKQRNISQFSNRSGTSRFKILRRTIKTHNWKR